MTHHDEQHKREARVHQEQHAEEQEDHDRDRHIDRADTEARIRRVFLRLRILEAAERKG